MMKSKRKLLVTLFGALGTTALLAIPTIALSSCEAKSETANSQQKDNIESLTKVAINQMSALSDDSGATTITINGNNLPLDINSYSFNSKIRNAKFEIVDGSTSTTVTLKSNDNQFDVDKNDLEDIVVSIKDGNKLVSSEPTKNKLKVQYKLIQKDKVLYYQLENSNKIVGLSNALGRAGIQVGIDQHVMNNQNLSIYKFNNGTEVKGDKWLTEFFTRLSDNKSNIILIQTK